MHLNKYLCGFLFKLIITVTKLRIAQCKCQLIYVLIFILNTLSTLIWFSGECWLINQVCAQ